MPASDELINRAVRFREVLDGHGVSLTGAAMQFPFQHPAVKAVLVGCRTEAEVLSNIAEFDKPIASQVWTDLASVQ
jgi:D-threo-aldose 1-dehydrogenase